MHKSKILKILSVIIFCTSILINYYLYKLYTETKIKTSEFEISFNKLKAETEACKNENDRLNSEAYKLKSMKTIYVPEYIHGEDYDEGYEEGKENGREEGFENGKEEGYEDGYERGKEDAQDDYNDNSEDDYHGY